MTNVDPATVRGFGEEWQAFDQLGLDRAELEALFEAYFRIFPWSTLPPRAEGFDLGSGSGRWARFVAPRVGKLHCIDASEAALRVAQRALAGEPACTFHHASVDAIPLADGSMDFGYSLGVLHHVPDTRAGIAACARKLKPGAPLLLYLYYAFDNRPPWYRALWRASDAVRKVVSALPKDARHRLSDALAASVYWPLATAARVGERAGAQVQNWPLAAYRHASFYTMRTDSLDRFGTRLEQRFSRREIADMMGAAGLRDITFADDARGPFWCALGYKAAPGEAS